MSWAVRKVQKSIAPAAALHAGTGFCFCSDGCHGWFVAIPTQFVAAGYASDTGRNCHSCSTSCRDRFTDGPEDFLDQDSAPLGGRQRRRTTRHSPAGGAGTLPTYGVSRQWLIVLRSSALYASSGPGLKGADSEPAADRHVDTDWKGKRDGGAAAAHADLDGGHRSGSGDTAAAAGSRLLEAPCDVHDRCPRDGSTRRCGGHPGFQNDPRGAGRWQRSGARLIGNRLATASHQRDPGFSFNTAYLARAIREGEHRNFDAIGNTQDRPECGHELVVCAGRHPRMACARGAVGNGATAGQHG